MKESPYKSRRSQLPRSAEKREGWRKIWARSRRVIGSSIASSPPCPLVPPGLHLPEHPLDPETVAAIIRSAGGNFRLLNRLLTQMERILEINSLQQVTKAVVKPRASLVIG